MRRYALWTGLVLALLVLAAAGWAARGAGAGPAIPHTKGRNTMLDSPRFSRRLAAAGLIAAPILLAVSFLFERTTTGDAAAYLADVAANRNAHMAWAALFALGAVLMLPGMLGVARLLRGRQGTIGRIGALALGVASVVIAGILLAISVVEVAMVDAAADRAQMIALSERTEEVGFGSAVFGVVWFGGFVLGSLALAIGLLIRRVVPIWSPLLLVGWLALLFFVEGRLGSILGSLALVAALAPLAYRIATLRDDQWARWQPLPDEDPRRFAAKEVSGAHA